MNVSFYPNPFNEYATISFELFKSSDVRIQLYDLQGKLLKTVCNNLYPAGMNQVILGKEDVKPGLYILKVNTKQTVTSIKISVN